MGVISGAGVKLLTFEDVGRASPTASPRPSTMTRPATRSRRSSSTRPTPHGLKVHGWTFAVADATKAPAEYRKYLDMGIDGMFSNYSDLARAGPRRLRGEVIPRRVTPARGRSPAACR